MEYYVWLFKPFFLFLFLLLALYTCWTWTRASLRTSLAEAVCFCLPVRRVCSVLALLSLWGSFSQCLLKACSCWAQEPPGWSLAKQTIPLTDTAFFSFECFLGLRLSYQICFWISVCLISTSLPCHCVFLEYFQDSVKIPLTPMKSSTVILSQRVNQ